MTRHLPLQLMVAVGATLALPAHAIDDDRFALRLGAMSVEAQSELGGRTIFDGEAIGFDEDFDLGGTETAPRIDGQLRFGTRNRVLFN